MGMVVGASEGKDGCGLDQLTEGEAGVIVGNARWQVHAQPLGRQAGDDVLGEQTILEHPAGEADRELAVAFTQLEGLGDETFGQGPVEGASPCPRTQAAVEGEG